MEFLYIHKSLAAGAVSRKSILVIISNRLAEQECRVIEVPCRKKPFLSLPRSGPCDQCKHILLVLEYWIRHSQSESASTDTGMVGSDGANTERTGDELGARIRSISTTVSSNFHTDPYSQHRPRFHLGPAYQLQSPSIPPPILNGRH